MFDASKIKLPKASYSSIVFNKSQVIDITIDNNGNHRINNMMIYNLYDLRYELPRMLSNTDINNFRLVLRIDERCKMKDVKCRMRTVFLDGL